MSSQAFRKFDLTGKTAVVTGGGSGLGYHMARGLIRSGAKVMITSRREDLLRDSAAMLRSQSDAGEVLYRPVDLTDEAQIKDMAQYAIDTMGGVDIFIGNAGIDGLGEYVETIEDQTMDAMFKTHVFANLQLMRAFVPGMREKKWGRILFSSSAASLASSPKEGMIVYTACKSALNAIARTTSTEVGHQGITVNALLLGCYMTAMFRDVSKMLDERSPGAGKAFIDDYAAMTSLGRIGNMGELEGPIQFLASDAGSYVTGACIALDGGLGIMQKPNTPPADPVYPELVDLN